MSDESNSAESGIAWLAQGDMSALRDMQRTLGRNGITSELLRPPAGDPSCPPGGG